MKGTCCCWILLSLLILTTIPQMGLSIYSSYVAFNTQSNLCQKFLISLRSWVFITSFTNILYFLAASILLICFFIKESIPFIVLFVSVNVIELIFLVVWNSLGTYMFMQDSQCKETIPKFYNIVLYFLICQWLSFFLGCCTFCTKINYGNCCFDINKRRQIQKESDETTTLIA